MLNADKTNLFKSMCGKKHNERYSYAKVNYIRNRDKVTITCPVHGDFEQTPSNHLKGQGCPKCARISLLQTLTHTLSTFIDKANTAHSGKYSYTRANYTRTMDKITITCPVHGDFEQTAHHHLKGAGCPSCAPRNTKYSYSEFTQAAKLKHGDKYSYKESGLIASDDMVSITCKIHGDFLQNYKSHLNGSGCRLCYFKKISSAMTHTKDDFLKKCAEVHKGTYDYSKVIYTSRHSSVVITCHKHGDFMQKPALHTAGHGCPMCGASKGEVLIRDILDKHNITYEREYTIPNQQYKFRYDFYLPLYNCVIEFHGKQHYHPIKFFGGEQSFKETKRRDMYKKWLCKELKIKMVELNYLHLKKLNKVEFESLLISNLVKG